jgi:hypothetical protein
MDMDGRWLTALVLGAFAVAPTAIGGLNRKPRKSRKPVGVSRHVATRAVSQIPSTRDLRRAVARRDARLETLALQIPVIR